LDTELEYPTDGESYTWNEEEGKWTLVITEE
jgi:hypothetical protein